MSRSGTIVLVIIFLIGAVAGCWTVHKRDPLTIQAFEAAIVARQEDSAIVERLLNDVAANPTRCARALEQVRFLTRAEVSRLDAARWREAQKTDQ